MKVKFYPSPNRDDGGVTGKEISLGHLWLLADVECPWCGKGQPVAATHHVGGPCVRCGKNTDGSAS